MANPGAPAGPVFSIYQATGLGVSLNETLGTLVDNNVLTEFEAGDIVDDFDQSFAEVMRSVPGPVNARLRCRGKLDYYKLVEGVWTFGVSDMEMQLANADKYKWYTLSGLKIVAMDGSESKRRRR